MSVNPLNLLDNEQLNHDWYNSGLSHYSKANSAYGRRFLGNRELKKVGLKVTAPRIKILHILETASARHFSAEDIYKILLDLGDDVGLATVYRVLTQFETAGLVIRHHFEGGHSVFELDDGKHHDHLVCVKCGHVEEFVDSVIETRQLDIAKERKFHMTDHSLNIYGICQNCSKK